MKTGLAIWHYPQRTLTENIRFFSAKGLTALSSHGVIFLDSAKDIKKRTALASAIREAGIEFTVHHFLPSARLPYTAAQFREDLSVFRRWQDDFGLISVLSFDVYEDARTSAGEYLEMAVSVFRGTGTRIAPEDYGLNESERKSIEHLKSEPIFGYLLDVGHMNMRLHGDTTAKTTLFRACGEAAPLPIGDHSAEAFENAFRSKEFPILELHLHNNNGAADQHRFLDEGNIDIPGIAGMLKRIGFDGIVTVESVPDWLGTDEDISRNKSAEKEFWRVLLSEFRVSEWTGTCDEARDKAILDTCGYWMDLIK